MADATQQDSSLSIAANITGILTFVFAALAAAYARVTYLRNSDQEFFQVKMSLCRYKTESAWLAELVMAMVSRFDTESQTQFQTFRHVMEDLHRLDKKLLELVEETETRARSENERYRDRQWALPVRQREALTAKVSFTQISTVPS
ncbi:hypothetical protein GGS23DRAFT_607960 [Durotheca rogersii]|uniref:uncharacterized protein n=1 Tax=Durotheca rogersii TaxID=419775 RepID=UPI0022203BC4|nr:uncharacterized protein GGS23DRAFT_607960 [Durotheca rogersii]KAI5856779.1 hypothetical protein GGS23DRAFT_607960 [Durotheca rogersii]